MNIRSKLNLEKYIQKTSYPWVRQMSLVAFICVFCIQILYLTGSYFSDRERLLARVDKSLELFLSLTSTAEDRGVIDKLFNTYASSSSFPLRAAVLEYPNGDGIRLGTIFELAIIDSTEGEWTSRFDSGTGDYLTQIFHQADSVPPYPAKFLVDASHVRSVLNSQYVNGLAIAFFISLVVVLSCVFVIFPLLFESYQRTKSGISDAYGKKSIDSPEHTVGGMGTTHLLDAKQKDLLFTSRFRDFAHLGADCLWEVDRSLRIRFICGDPLSLFGLSPELLLGERIDELAKRSDFPFTCAEELVTALRENQLWEGELRKESQTDSSKTVRLVCRALVRDDGTVIGARGIIVNTTSASKLAHDLNHIATHDALTGLYNRRHFDELLQLASNNFRRKEVPFCACLLDLDRFKIVNDSCGHAAGDELLKALSNIISQCAREHDVVSRYGGDEFTMVLNDCRLKEAVVICENIRTAISDFRFVWDGIAYEVGVSIGIAEAEPGFSKAAEVLSAADASCFKAKRQGRNQVQTHSADDVDSERIEGDKQWMIKLNQSLENDRLVLFQQPIVTANGENQNRIQFEVLVRLVEEDGQIVTPASFFPAAERYGLMERIDRRVLRMMIDWLAEQRVPSHLDLQVHMNIASSSIADKEFQNLLLRSILEAPIDPSHLCIEIQAAYVVQNIAEISDFFNTLSEIGCKIALDDFCTGLASLGHLKDLPIDYIKLDGFFVHEVSTSVLERVLVKSIAEVAGVLNIRTIAEQVETKEVMTTLRDLGVGYAQGYLNDQPSRLVQLSDFAEYSLLQSPDEPLKKVS